MSVPGSWLFLAFRGSGYYFACWWIYYSSLFLLPFSVFKGSGYYFACWWIYYSSAFVLVTSKCRPQLECNILCDGFSQQLIMLKIWWASRTGLKEVLVDLQSLALT